MKQSEDLYDVEVDPAFGYRMISFFAVFSAISNVVVSKVCKSEVKFIESGKRGLGFKIVVFCEKTVIPSCPFVETDYETIRRIVLVMRLLGIGLHEMTKFCAFMELPRPIFQSFYDKVVKKMSIATDAVFKNSMVRAVK